MHDHFLIKSMKRYIGQTVTIFTTSGGLSGNGFTGVLAAINECSVRLITDIGAPPSCPIGSACCGGYFDGGWEETRGRCETRCGKECRGGGCRDEGRRRGRWGMGWLGSVTEIPLEKIASFTHNAL
ncbi:MAG: hypothetical protein FWC71_03915 [Defluviitaleaceae bacterium]|nr:hypothetical protein [Defluviitaleaceae bacterium]